MFLYFLKIILPKIELQIMRWGMYEYADYDRSGQKCTDIATEFPWFDSERIVR